MWNLREKGCFLKMCANLLLKGMPRTNEQWKTQKERGESSWNDEDRDGNQYT